MDSHHRKQKLIPLPTGRHLRSSRKREQRILNNNSMSEIKSKSYTLRTESGSWLGQIVLTSDGMFASVTDYGNLSFGWRSTGRDDFRQFICELNVEYFGGKMYQGNTYILYSKKCQEACMRFAEKILPPLQKLLRQDIIDNPKF